MRNSQEIDLLVTDRAPQEVRRILAISVLELLQLPKKPKILIPGSGMFPGDLVKDLKSLRRDAEVVSVDPSLGINPKDLLSGQTAVFYRAVDAYNVALYHSPPKSRYTYLPAEQAASFQSERLLSAKTEGKFIPDYIQNVRLAERSYALVMDCLGPAHYLRSVEEKLKYVQSIILALVPNGLASLYSISFVEGADHIPAWQIEDAVQYTSNILLRMGNVHVDVEAISEDQAHSERYSLRVKIKKLGN